MKSVQTTAQADDNEPNTGTIQSNDTFTWFDHNDRTVTPHKGVSDCHGGVQNHVVVKYTADATPTDTSLEIDLVGGFRVAGSTDNNELSCANSPDLRNADGQPSAPASWGFGWDPEAGPTTTNQQMQLTASIPRAAIGLPSISPILSNASKVSSSENCTDLHIDSCSVTFKLGGELELTKICNGTIGAGGIGTCTGGGGGGGNNPPTSPPPSKPPKLTHLKVTPATFTHGASSVHISYKDDQPGSQTLLKITGTITVAGHTVGPIPFTTVVHVDTAKNSVALPAMVARVLQPGHYTVVATATNLKTHKQSAPATATFHVK